MKRSVLWSRDALDDLNALVAFIDDENPVAAGRISKAILDSAGALGAFSTGRPGRFSKTYEKSVSRLPYIIAYSVGMQGESETIRILRVIHTARHWPAGGWPSA